MHLSTMLCVNPSDFFFALLILRDKKEKSSLSKHPTGTHVTKNGFLFCAGSSPSLRRRIKVAHKQACSLCEPQSPRLQNKAP